MLIEHYYFNRYISLHQKESLPLLENVLRVGHLIAAFTFVTVGNQKKAFFWEDMCAIESNLKTIFPTLYWVALGMTFSIEKFISKYNIEENFRLPLPRQAIVEMSKLKLQLMNIILSEESDIRIWKWLPRNTFTVSSYYKFLKHGVSTSHFGKIIWKLLILEKYKTSTGWVTTTDCSPLKYLQRKVY